MSRAYMTLGAWVGVWVLTVTVTAVLFFLFIRENNDRKRIESTQEVTFAVQVCVSVMEHEQTYHSLARCLADYMEQDR